MGRTIQTEYTCSLCEVTNQIQIPKPLPLQHTITRQTCEHCDSVFILKFFRIAGEGFQMRVDSVRVVPSPMGLTIYKEKHPPKAEQPKEILNGNESISANVER